MPKVSYGEDTSLLVTRAGGRILVLALPHEFQCQSSGHESTPEPAK
jgi:hypothetical protein